MDLIKFKGNANITLGFDKVGHYGNVDGLSLQNLYYATHGYFPNCYLFDYNPRKGTGYKFDTNKMLEHFKKTIPEDENVEISVYTTKILGDEEEKMLTSFCIILNKSDIYARFEDDVTESYILYSNDNVDSIQWFVDEALKFYAPPKDEENTYWKICSSQNGYYLEKGHSKCPAGFDINKLYNDTFAAEDERIKSFIEKEDESGLILLHGEKGTGKSSYIKHLISEYPGKKFVYIPSHLVNLLADPSFGSFLTTLNNNILILEDCENVIMDRKQNARASAVSLLLNMTDGLLSDDLGIKFICTFNDNMKNIDPALLRKGRCVSKYEFSPLCVEKSKELLLERGFDVQVDKPMPLSDIFHFEDEDYEYHKKQII